MFNHVTVPDHMSKWALTYTPDPNMLCYILVVHFDPSFSHPYA